MIEDYINDIFHSQPKYRDYEHGDVDDEYESLEYDAVLIEFENEDGEMITLIGI